MSVTSPVLSTTPEETEAVGERLARRIRAGDALLLEGDLAAGKTTLVRGVVQALGGDPSEVASPSFVLIRTYPCAAPGIDRLHHVDLYRLADRVPDLREIGLQEILSETAAVVAVEWPRNTLIGWLPDDARLWRVELTIEEDGARAIRVTEPAESGPR